MTATPNPKIERAIIRGDALHLPLRDNSVDLCISSPPYFALRDYSTGHEKEIGSEATPHAYLKALWAATREMARVLKPSGSIWVNLGDKYAERGGPARDPFADGGVVTYRAARPRRRSESETSIREKSLIGLPWRYAIGCIDQLGLILRAELIWNKPNGLPESVTDRVKRSHETWFHLVKQPRYYAALDEIRTPHAPDSLRVSKHAPGRPMATARNGSLPHNPAPYDGPNPLGALLGSVWTVPSEPLRLPPWIDESHYASFPSRWPEQLIKAFSPPGLCLVCGQGRFPVVDRRNRPLQVTYNGHLTNMPNDGDRRTGVPQVTEATILGYACPCCPHTDHPGTDGRERNGQGYAEETGHDAHPHGGVGMLPRTGPWREYHLDRWTPPHTRPAVVLDPFSGTGTVPHVAHALGRIGIGIDLSEAYCRLATDETLARQRAAKVHGRTNRERQGTLL